MSEFTGCIYLLRCKENGKVYIGQTTNLKRRLYYHFNKNTIKFNNNPIYKDVVLYGKSGFDVEVLGEVQADSPGDLYLKMIDLEKKKIIEYNSIETGYNIELGNELSSEMIEKMRIRGRAYSPSLETRRKISEATRGIRNHNYGKPVNEETRKKLSEAHKGKKRSESSIEKQRKRVAGEGNPFFGKKHSKEAKEKMSASRIGKQKGADNPAARAVRCIETGEIFSTARLAAEAKNISSPCNISFVCSGRTCTCGGYHWEYADESERDVTAF